MLKDNTTLINVMLKTDHQNVELSIYLIQTTFLPNICNVLILYPIFVAFLLILSTMIGNK